jgi:hypothetical protein
MSVRLRNRKAAEAKLGAFLDSLALPPALIDGVLLATPDGGFAVRRASHGQASCMQTGGSCWLPMLHAAYPRCRQRAAVCMLRGAGCSRGPGHCLNAGSCLGVGLVRGSLMRADWRALSVLMLGRGLLLVSWHGLPLTRRGLPSLCS